MAIDNRRVLALLVPLAAAAGLALAACADAPPPLPGEIANPSAAAVGRTGSLVVGGDFQVARNFNEVVHAPGKWRNVFSREVARLVAGADAAVFNAEGVIAGGGEFARKPEPDPYLYRAHPAAVALLRQLGVDALSVGNNHTGDYGPDAYREMLDRLRGAGIGFFGGGYSRAEAEAPAYVRVGDAVVALVGGNLTRPDLGAAGPDRPGSLHFPARALADEPAAALATYARILARARRHASVVLFSPHWGENWEREPTPAIRGFARKMIRLGYDGVVGHSAHLAQGVELVDGKPVVYDAGNSLLDFSIDNRKWPSLLWRLGINRAGVTAATGYPLRLRRNRTELAKGELAAHVLGHVEGLSRELGTPVVRRGETLVVACRPGGLFAPQEPPPAPAAGPIRTAPARVLVAALPAGTAPLRARFANGALLVGYRLAPDAVRAPRGAALLQLFFTADAPLTAAANVRLRAVERDAAGAIVKTTDSAHVPGDGLLPMGEWPVGRLVLDETVIRLAPRDGSTVSFLVALGGKRVLAVAESRAAVVDGGWIPLGARPARRGVPFVFAAIAALERAGRW